ncbi:MAG: protein kinase [Phycisphaerae bacterium]|nr:protein kinase [Phycisphaerae bacterium]
MAFAFKHGDRPLDGFTIQRAIGRGGFGEVYYAVSDGGREVALKYLRENPETELRGVAHCINLKSPHLVTIFDIRRNDLGEYFVVMEYVAGPSLRDILVAEPNGLGVDKTAYLVREIAKGLIYLHDRGIVHRDLKPGNIFYDDGFVKIGDYGLSKFIAESRHSNQTVSVGTLHYMAPEVGSGNYSKSIDVYALGVMTYEMLCGRVPFEGGSAGEVLIKHLTAQPDVSVLPPPFDRVVAKAMAKDPNERYLSAEDMVTELTAVGPVRESLAGFQPSSLSQAAARVRVAAPDSPAHSPNPAHRRYPLPPPARQPAYAGIPVAVAAPARATDTAFRDRHREMTPEAQRGHLLYAGFWIRVLAALIDGVVVGGAGSVLGPFGLLIGFVYEPVLLTYWEGQTIGKRVCGIRVISNDGRYCGLGQAIVRSLAEYLSAVVALLGYLWVAVDDKKRGWHDHIAGTLHVYAVK